MNLLAFDTSTERMSVAVRAGLAGPVLGFEGGGGAQTSASLIPAIQDLLAQAGLALGQLDAIVFGRGPGSFTGLRTACSVAQGLGFGSGVPVLAVDTLLAVAEEARAASGATQVVAVLDARMDEVYWARYAWSAGAWAASGGPLLGAPEDVQVPSGATLAGNALALHAARLTAEGGRVEAWPTAAALLRLAPALLTAGLAAPAAQALPLYVRDKVAQTSAERAAIRASK
ncbi:tRNA (adenosine(37)-N6)-threonylcarbamoyltransferase complex dimerization subunit type 1 TsaB [Caenimonas sedimenti]|uniref:tRNA (Adenosine(37)-N6)-threonylcarbamoyltransferase complex dimerization subunit type 1 TsaB n=1 Tax=Caenimonas sedimenti TaxID=2596921 RepID=A0A562ZMT0_9BURK|nr:tRNA (adenosine(37)-N6)-threonylcarbamoyltransferase complex dimerization subunit type 1 TsaB [Caenimonas sedimenti]TWO69681.1 tRNA (adenosine(37)-N6)-threonylcarbamoyltransferase complex dimerization subunit type 1 TsaB [Caenimonas sedimenti]